MVSETILAGILGLVGTVFTGLVVAGLWIWRHTTSIGVEDQDRINELENEERSEFSNELTELYLDIDRHIEQTDPSSDDMSKEEHVINTIELHISEDDLESVVAALNEIGTVRSIYEDHEDAFQDSYRWCWWAAVAVLALGLAFAAVYISETDLFSTGPVILYLTLGINALRFGYYAYSEFRTANKMKNEFEERWREYKRPD